MAEELVGHRDVDTVHRTAAAGVNLTGRTAVVTGGGSGVGRACAVRLARAGAAVTVVDLDDDAATSTAHAIGRTACAVDLTDARVLDVTGEIVVNNTGFQHIAPFEEFPPEKLAALLRHGRSPVLAHPTLTSADVRCRPAVSSTFRRLTGCARRRSSQAMSPAGSRS